MADSTNNGSGGISNTVLYLGGGALVLGVAAFIYMKFGVAKKTSNGYNAPDAKSNSPKPSSPATTSAPASTGKNKDLTIYPNSQAWNAKTPATLNGLNLGTDVTIRAGATVTQMDEGLTKLGTKILTVDTALGKVWGLNPSSVVIRAKDSFDHPFYQVLYPDINVKGSIVDKAVGELKHLFGFDNGYIGADGFEK